MQNTRPEITQMLSKLTERHINPHKDTRIYWAKEITFDYSHSAKRVDYMRFKPLNNSVSGIEKVMPHAWCVTKKHIDKIDQNQPQKCC